MSKEEVEKMVKESEMHAEEDKKRKEEAETRNLADSMCYTAEKSLRDAGDKVPEDLKKEIEEKVKSIRDNLQTDSVETLKQKTQELSLALQKIGEYIYKQGGQPEAEKTDSTGNGTGNSGGDNKGEGKDNKEDEPVEGEVVE